MLRVALGERGTSVCEIVPSSGAWEAPWQCTGYSLPLGQAAEPEPDRYIVVNKAQAAAFIFETAARDYWSKNKNGTWDAPLVTGDFFRLDGNPAPLFTMERLMKQTAVRPRRLTPKEARFLDDRKTLGAFRVLADVLRAVA